MKRPWYLFVVTVQNFGPSIPWLPSMVMFSSDQTLKGLSVFSSRENAQKVIDTLSDPSRAAIYEIGKEVDWATINERIMFLFQMQAGGLIDTMSLVRAAMELPVYDDAQPGADVTNYKWTCSQFMKQELSFEDEWKIHKMEHYKGYTIAVNEHTTDKDFASVVTQGIYNSREEIMDATQRGIVKPDRGDVSDWTNTAEEALQLGKAIVDSKQGAAFN